MSFNLATSCFKEKGANDKLAPSQNYILVLIQLPPKLFSLYLESMDTNAESSAEGTY